LISTFGQIQYPELDLESTMPSQRKRTKRRADPEVIDLTESSPPRAKAPKSSNGSQLHSSQIHSSQSRGSHFPSSSQVNSSFSYAPAHDDEEYGFDEDFVEDGVDLTGSQNFNSLINYCLYGTLRTKVVGCRYYSGSILSYDEMVLIRREPHNQYDRNAIQVLNVRGEQIGHIPRTIAEKLAPLMDNGSLLVEGNTAGPKAFYDCPLALRFYGSDDPVVRQNVKEDMKANRLPIDGLTQKDREEREREKKRQEQEQLLKKAKRAGVIVGAGNGETYSFSGSQFAGSSGAALAPNLQEIMRESERFNPRSFDEMADKLGRSIDILEKMPMAKQPKSIKTLLLPFQLQGLQWMLDRESPEIPAVGSKESVQLWKRAPNNPKAFTHMATNFSIGKEPELASGGVLADDMGLGKTLQVISLVFADKERGKVSSNVASATLLIAPLSVMSNWTKQIHDHVHKDQDVKVLVYHGTNRPVLTIETVKEYDFVVTTYDTIRSEHFGKKRQGGIRTVKWRRIVLDEGHNIRNPAAKTTTAICDIIAQSRWVLTGTPIVNTLKDLFSLVRFLRLSGGIDRWELFNGAIIRPLNAGFENAGKLLQSLMDSICLRRKKDMKFIDLKVPELSEYIHKIDFAPHETEKYDALAAEAAGTLEEYHKKKGKSGVDASKAYRHLLEVLLRLRQVCNHWELVPEKRLKQLEGLDGPVDLTPENRKTLEEMLKLNIESSDDCPVCLETLTDPIITLCTHTFCFACIEKVIDTQHKCPMCRNTLEDTNKLIRPPKEGTDTESKIQPSETSSKVEALLSILNASRNGKGNKTVVFSQWTSFLDVVGVQLGKHGHKFVRIDGTMSTTARDAAMSALESDPEVTVLLASLGVCSVGLNLVAANQVILADSWWAPAIEDQAVDRVHRLGQTRKTTIFRLVMKGSIEEHVVGIQQKKRKLMMLAFAEKNAKRGNEKGARLADIETLLRGTQQPQAATN
jgi:SWI/SNF-related matrix-associated actin-dependent regulator of chromatin subfamily A3